MKTLKFLYDVIFLLLKWRKSEANLPQDRKFITNMHAEHKSKENCTSSSNDDNMLKKYIELGQSNFFYHRINT